MFKSEVLEWIVYKYKGETLSSTVKYLLIKIINFFQKVIGGCLEKMMIYNKDLFTFQFLTVKYLIKKNLSENDLNKIKEEADITLNGIYKKQFSGFI